MTALESIDDGLFACDAEWRIVYMNAEAGRILGIDRDQVLGRSLWDVLAREPGAGLEEEYRKSAAGETRTFERFDETTGRRYHYRCFPCKGGGMSVHIQDITERRRMENDLRVSEEKYRSLVEISTDCIWEMDGGGRFTYLSPKFEDITGYTPEEFLGKSPFDIVTEETMNRVGGQLLACIHSRGSFSSLEQQIRHRDGRPVMVEVSVIPLFGPDGEYRGQRGITRDVTERKRVVQALHETEERFRGFMDNSPAIAWMKDEEGRYVYLNRSYQKRMHVRLSDVVGKTDLELWPEHIARQFRENDLAVLNSDQAIEMMEEGIDLRGEHSYWWNSKFPIRDGAGRRYVGGIGIDITRLKQMESELMQARDAAVSANRAKSRFLANMSHEIRTPMTGIMACVQFLEDTDMTAEQRECLEAIRLSSGGLLSLINDMLDLSKIESGRIVLEKSGFSLRSSIGEVVRSQFSLIRSKGLGIDTDIPPSVPDDLIGDQIRLKQILLNLLGNAVKFTSRGGIRITVECLERHGGTVLLRIGVTDTGIGISPEQMETIFKPFVQGDSSDTRKYGGTGLGLTICTRFVELMGGKMWVESAEGAGSTFYVQVPFSVDRAVSRSGERGIRKTAPPPWEGPSLRILLADDQEINLLATARLLERRGHTVVLARDGEEALRKWRENEPDTMLVDIQMPGMTGIEVARTIRDSERETGAHVPIIALTGRAFREEREDILNSGFDGYMAKPFEIGALLDELRRCLPKDTDSSR
jgi:two-component system CheB/CheR fusion protein